MGEPVEGGDLARRAGRLDGLGHWLKKGTGLRRRALLAGGVALAAVAGVSGGAFALSSSSTASAVSAPAPSTPSPPTAAGSGPLSTSNHSGTKAAAGAKRKVRAKELKELAAIRARIMKVARRAVDVEATVKTKDGFVTFSLVRGKLTSATSTSLVVSEADGKTLTDTIGSSTRFFPKSLSGASGLVDGENVVVLSKGGDALAVWVPSARKSSAHESSSGQSSSGQQSATQSPAS